MIDMERAVAHIPSGLSERFQSGGRKQIFYSGNKSLYLISFQYMNVKTCRIQLCIEFRHLWSNKNNKNGRISDKKSKLERNGSSAKPGTALERPEDEK